MKSLQCEKNFLPFNDVWYHDCFFHGLAQMAHNYGFLPKLFENDYFKYSLDYKDGLPVISLDIIKFKPWQTIFEENCVDVSWVESGDSCLDEICRHLDAGEDIMLPVDCFYEDIRQDTFGKIHLLHFFVVYGYDSVRQEFLLLEHNYENDLYYKNTRISFFSALEAHKAYPAIRGLDKARFLTFKKNGASVAKETDKADMHEGLASFFASLSELETFIGEFRTVKHIFFDEEKRFENVNFYRHTFGTVFGGKKYQSYFCTNFFEKYGMSGFEDFVGMENCNDWGLLMGMLARCKLTQKIQEDMFDRLLKILNRIVAREREYKEVYESLYGKYT